MKRARAKALVLVNWKGVFYERYLLDSNVTALEGPNGAGKTTVMVAAYIALLSDLGRLRFSNVGESSASGGDKGIWGRLGERARPSYVGLLVQTSDESAVLLGVHLERKSEPSMELSPFMVHGLNPEVALSELFLEVSDDSEEVPTFKGLKAQLKAYSVEHPGVRVEFFASVKEYLTALFDLGIAPLRLAADEERGKFNEMLRTSMTGGISRALTSELRNFVFKQEPQLSDTLTRMRANLNACRRTRTEVAESRKLEAEINGIFDAGYAVFRSAYYATLADKEQAEGALFDARDAQSRLTRELEQLALSIRDESARKATLDARLETLESEFAEAHALAQRVERACAIKTRLEALRAEQTEAEKVLIAAELKLKQATEARRLARLERTAAQEQLTRSASALADLQTGLDELHHQARAHRRLTTLLKQIAEQTGDADFCVDDAPQLLVKVGEEISNLDETRTGRNRARQDLQQQRADYERALGALAMLESVTAAAVDDGEIDVTVEVPAQELSDVVFERARKQLAVVEKLEALVAGREHLELENERLLAEAARQRSGRARYWELRGNLQDSAPSDETSEALAGAVRHLETSILAQENEHRERLWQAQVAAQNEREARLRQLHLAEEQERWQGVRESASRLEAVHGSIDHEQDAVVQLYRNIQRAREQAVARQDQLGERATQARARADKMETMAGDFPPDLLRLRDELEGALLARRYEHLEPSQARLMQAKLGPLLEAVVVTDLEQAVAAVLDQPRECDDVWLLDPVWELEQEHTESPALSRLPKDEQAASHDVVMRFPAGARISRVPDRGVLGKAALEAEVTRLRAEAEQFETDQEKLGAQLAAVETQLTDIAVIRDSLGLWLQEGPAQTREETENDAQLAQQSQEQSRRAALELRESITRAHAELDALREMAPLVQWVELPSLEERSAEVATSLARVKAVAKGLSQCRRTRAELESLLYCLKNPPPSEEAVTEWQQEDAALARRRDEQYQRQIDLEEVMTVRHGAAFGDASTLLLNRTELVPALEEQLKQAQELNARAEESVAAVEKTAEALTLARGERQAALLAVQAHVQRAEEELSAEGLAEPTQRAQQSVAETLVRLERSKKGLLAERQSFASRQAVKEERVANAEKALSEASRRLSQTEESALPKQGVWSALEEQRKAAGLPAPRRIAGQERAQWPEVDGRLALLCDRLLAARGTELAAEAREYLANPRPAAEGYLRLWVDVRSWLKRRLPAQVADVPEPQDALARLRADLEGLEQRLMRQESQLRGNSEDVARSIDAQLRKASAQVRRLNQYLTGVSFGGISRIRVQHGRVERMTQVLAALRDGSAQALLFQSNLPIEEALDEIFKRYAGASNGGQRILDYREYLELGVQVQRRGQENWEAANPSRVSTGEAIGVGAALMMVILTEWERDANLLRKKQPMGSLRFLFLDEANRLSQENLGVLFELCQALELQLLIAAPEVAQAEGNTTYRLVRRPGADGQDEVIVSGRRAVTLSEEDAAQSPVAEAVVSTDGDSGKEEELAEPTDLVETEDAPVDGAEPPDSGAPADAFSSTEDAPVDGADPPDSRASADALSSEANSAEQASLFD